MDHLSLYELQRKIKDSLINAFPLPIWIAAEISELKVNYSGHCYMELVEKEDANSVKIRAKATAIVWANKYRLIKSYFESMAHMPLTEGLKVLVRVDVSYHELYGLSLTVMDIDPSYTVGELKIQRQLIVQQLIDEGILDLNKQLDFPLVPQRVAVVSSATAAGLQDFVNQLTGNPFGYKFDVTLFPAVMQGNEAESSIIEALGTVYARMDEFDVVAIIRGGGSQTDLVCFDAYGLSANVAQFPLPILTGIGHDKDESVCDIVAYQNFKTPTAVASFLVDMLSEFESEAVQVATEISRRVQQVLQAQRMITMNVEYALLDHVKQVLSSEDALLNRLVFDLSYGVNAKLTTAHRITDRFEQDLSYLAKRIFVKEKDELQAAWSSSLRNIQLHMQSQSNLLEGLEARARSSSPLELFKKGYSITLHNGKIVRDLEGLEGQQIETIVERGTVISEVKKVSKN